MTDNSITVDYRSRRPVALGPNDVMVSGNDLAFAGLLIGAPPDDEHHLSAAIASLVHLLTRLVMSERLVVLADSDAKEPTSWILPLLSRHCKVSILREDLPIVGDVFSTVWDNPTRVFDVPFCAAALESEQRFSEQKFIPMPTHLLHELLEEPELARQWFDMFPAVKASLSEYAIAEALSIPFAPSPAFSAAVLAKEVQPSVANEELVQLVDDMRSGVALQFNTIKKAEVYDLQLPSIATAVLKQASSVPEAIQIAASMNTDAAPFRTWCANLEKVADPKVYVEHFESAKASLERLGRVVGAKDGSRMAVTVTAGPLSIDLPSQMLGNLCDYLDVDIRFFRARRFLLNVLSEARQVSRLGKEISRVVGVDADTAAKAARLYLERSAKK